MKDEIVFNYLLDLRKRPIDKFVRARLIKKYLFENKLTERDLAKQIGVPHSTMSDWLLFTKITDEQYEKLKSKGFDDKKINYILRNDKKIVDGKINDDEITKLDFEIEEFIKVIRYYNSKLDKKMITTMTDSYVVDLVNELNRLRMKIERL